VLSSKSVCDLITCKGENDFEIFSNRQSVICFNFSSYNIEIYLNFVLYFVAVC